jgi:predicted lipase
MFASIEPEITDIVLSHQHHITFCGHSLGGAIAMFAAVYYSHMTNCNTNISCHTFGTPKLGDAEFVKWFADYVPNAVNVYNKYDIVAYYPFDASFSSLPNTVGLSATTGNPVADHDLDKYIENIVNAISKK